MNLTQWMEDNGKSDAWLAEQIGVSRPFITRIRNGERTPSLPIAVKLANLTKLPAATFIKAAA